MSDRPPFAGRNLDNMSDAGSERGIRRGFGDGDGRMRDFSNWERKGPLSPASPAATSLRDGGRQHSKDGPGFRHNSPAWGEGRSQEGSRPPRREHQDRPTVERAPTAAESDNQWRSRMQPDAAAKPPTPETSTPPSPAPQVASNVRPKLNLQKRTVSEAQPTPSAPSTDSKASPFGAARPVDTATKEKEVEEKRQQAMRERREAEEKARAEKAEEPKEDKENGGTAKPTPKFDILRRVDSGTNDMLLEEEAEEENEELPISEDNAVKPKEIVRDAPDTKTNGEWRKSKPSPPAEAASTTTETLEEDGWSTVSKPTKQRNQRRNFQPTRALAS